MEGGESRRQQCGSWKVGVRSERDWNLQCDLVAEQVYWETKGWYSLIRGGSGEGPSPQVWCTACDSGYLLMRLVGGS